MPVALARAFAPLNDAVGGLPGMPANLRETIAAGDGVTYWASHDKASRELDFQPRSLEQGIADTWGNHG
jgi:nucleoside-diphosphate-sugar epimerase